MFTGRSFSNTFVSYRLGSVLLGVVYKYIHKLFLTNKLKANTAYEQRLARHSDQLFIFVYFISLIFFVKLALVI